MMRILAVASLATLNICVACGGESASTENDAVSSLSSNSEKLVIASASADEAQSPNVPANVLDGRNDTRWSGFGSAVNLFIDLGTVALVDYLRIAFHRGDERTNAFEIYTRESSNDGWTLVGTKTSSGLTNGLQTFDVRNSNARHVRILCKGNSSNLWNSLTQVEVWGTGGSTGGPGGEPAPGQVLGLTSSTWKLNGFTGSPGSSAVYEDDVLSATGTSFDTYSDDDYFYTDGTWTFFKVYRGLGGSRRSGNPRVELRELVNGRLASWDGSSGNNSMTWTVRVDRLPKDTDGRGGVLCFGQIHGPSNGTDDVIRVQFIGDEDQTTGPVRLKISGYITEEVLGGSVILDRGYRLDTAYTFRLTYNNGIVELFSDGERIFSQAMDTSTEGNYFKVGNYLQSVQGASFTGSFGLVAVRSVTITH